jgi:hypothetical protein
MTEVGERRSEKVMSYLADVRMENWIDEKTDSPDCDAGLHGADRSFSERGWVSDRPGKHAAFCFIISFPVAKSPSLLKRCDKTSREVAFS